jgi:hypothetical protein
MSQTVLSGTLFFAGTTQLYNTSAGKRVRYPYSSGTAVCRGKSRRPLFVSAIGMRPSEAASRIKEMAGPHRIPGMLNLADQLTKGFMQRGGGGGIWVVSAVTNAI